MKILLDTSFFGGTGGLEKLVKQIIFQKKQDMEIDVFVSCGFNNEPTFVFDKVKFVQLDEIIFSKYDLYLKIGTNYNYDFFNKFRKDSIKVLNPAGYVHNTEILNFFDYLWEESPNSYDSYQHKNKIVVCPPSSLEYKEPRNNPIIGNVSEKFFVTAANDYDINVKGIDLIYKFAEISPVDLVWFCSDTKASQTALMDKSKKPEKLKIARNMPNNIIYDTINKCSAYICFSRRESFGQSLAEAMLLNKPIFTQKVGVVKYNPNLFNLYDENNINKINNTTFNLIQDYSEITKHFNRFWDNLFEKIKT